MKSLFTGVAAVALLVSPVLAQTPAPGTTKSFQEVKEHRLQRLDAMRACIVKATNFDDLKACSPKWRHQQAPAQ